MHRTAPHPAGQATAGPADLPPHCGAATATASPMATSTSAASAATKADAEDFDHCPEAAVLTAPDAPVPETWAAEMAALHWGKTGHLAPLAGERDRNFLLTEPGGATATGPRWLLKASHPIEPPEVTDYQTQALLHLARHAPELPVQRLALTRQGAASVRVPAPDGRLRVLRLIGWREGLPMPQAPRSAAQRASVADTLARVDRALAAMDPQGLHPATGHALPWDIQRAHRVASLVQAMPDAARRHLAQTGLDHFSRLALPHLGALPRQPIHNDFNIHNLLVDPQQPSRLAAVLDFGDMVAAPRVNDLAVAAAYQLEPDAGPAQALDTVAAFAAAYHRQWPLTAAELDLLWPLVLARLVMVVAISGWRAQRQPDKAEYLLRNNPISWARLAACVPVAPEAARRALREACGLESVD